MKKFFFFVAASLMATMVMAETVKPTTVPGKPNMTEANVMAVYCDVYQNNNLNFTAQGWSGSGMDYQLGQTKMVYYASASYDGFTNGDSTKYDVSAFNKLHMDVWVTDSASFKVKIQALDDGDGGSGYASSYQLPNGLVAGWNSIDLDLATAYSAYDFKDLRYILFEGLGAYEFKPLAITNIVFYSGDYSADASEQDPQPKEEFPANAPTALPEGEIPSDAMGIVGSGFDSTLNFTSAGWGGGAAFVEYNLQAGGSIFYSKEMSWQGFGNAGADKYDVSAFNTLVVELYACADASVKVTIEACKEAEGGQEGDFKNGVQVTDLKANTWKVAKIPFSKFVYASDSTKSYNFQDMRYLVLEDFTAEGTEPDKALTVGRVYVCTEGSQAVEDLSATDNKAHKMIVNGRLVIEHNGVLYNALGAQL